MMKHFSTHPLYTPNIFVELLSGAHSEIGCNVSLFGLISRAYKHAEVLANP